jgi:hypothetical protein
MKPLPQRGIGEEGQGFDNSRKHETDVANPRGLIYLTPLGIVLD